MNNEKRIFHNGTQHMKHTQKAMGCSMVGCVVNDRSQSSTAQRVSK